MTIKKDLSWWDYDKHNIITSLFNIGFIIDDTQNVEWRIWHHEKTKKELFYDLNKGSLIESTLLPEGNGYYLMSAMTTDIGQSIQIEFNYEDYSLVSVSFYTKDDAIRFIERE